MLERKIEYNNLFDVYGSLLTPKQRQTLEYFLFDDLNFTEISKISNITKQGVSQCVQNAIKYMEKLESTIKLINQREKTATSINELLNKVDELSVLEIKESLKQIREDCVNGI